MYFEHRRDRSGRALSGRGLEAVQQQDEDVKGEVKPEDEQPIKREIVGYGEDGKAIYADGSTGDEDVGPQGRGASFEVWDPS